MKIADLQRLLEEVIRDGKNLPTDEVKFRHSINSPGSIYSSVDYVLTAAEPKTLTLCYDDGHF